MVSKWLKRKEADKKQRGKQNDERANKLIEGGKQIHRYDLNTERKKGRLGNGNKQREDDDNTAESKQIHQ